MNERGPTTELGVMTALPNLLDLVAVQADATVSRTVLRADGARVVLFAFDQGQSLTEHTAAVPILIQALDGHLQVRADGQEVDLRPGGLLHLAARVPHAVDALVPSRMALTMLSSVGPR